MNNNNEQDLILKQKIEKREKFDTILAYVLLAILLVCIILVLWLKLTEKEEQLEPPVDEYTPTYISLSEITSALNTSTLVSGYINDGTNFNASVSGNSINVTYANGDINFSMNMPMVGSELMINVPTENGEIVTEIYKEIGNIICMYYGNEEKYCRYTINNMSNDGLDGIRFDNNTNNNTVYINTTKSFTVVNEIVYTEVTTFDINENEYVLELNDTRVNNIVIATSDTNVVVTGNIERLTDDRANLSVVVKLYDNENNLLGENKYEYNEENVLEVSGTFQIEFILSEILKLENISKYSIEIVK